MSYTFAYFVAAVVFMVDKLSERKNSLICSVTPILPVQIHWLCFSPQPAGLLTVRIPLQIAWVGAGHQHVTGSGLPQVSGHIPEHLWLVGVGLTDRCTSRQHQFYIQIVGKVFTFLKPW